MPADLKIGNKIPQFWAVWPHRPNGNVNDFSSTAELQQAIDKILLGKAKLAEEDKILTFKIQTRRGQRGSWGKFVKVDFYYPWDGGKEPRIVGIETED